MRPAFVPHPDDLDGLLVHASEECSEVIKAACKIQRFGFEFITPKGVRLDFRKDLMDEIADAKAAFERLVDCVNRRGNDDGRTAPAQAAETQSRSPVVRDADDPAPVGR